MRRADFAERLHDAEARVSRLAAVRSLIEENVELDRLRAEIKEKYGPRVETVEQALLSEAVAKMQARREREEPAAALPAAAPTEVVETDEEREARIELERIAAAEAERARLEAIAAERERERVELLAWWTRPIEAPRVIPGARVAHNGARPFPSWQLNGRW